LEQNIDNKFGVDIYCCWAAAPVRWEFFIVTASSTVAYRPGVDLKGCRAATPTLLADEPTQGSLPPVTEVF